jgi:hypothetical protein
MVFSSAERTRLPERDGRLGIHEPFSIDDGDKGRHVIMGVVKKMDRDLAKE